MWVGAAWLGLIILLITLIQLFLDRRNLKEHYEKCYATN